jgi:starch phosphorylase
MSDATSALAPTEAFPTGIEALTELAMDLRWSWCHSSDELWKRLDPVLWARTTHPSSVLQSVSRERLAEALRDSEFCALLEQLIRSKREAAAAPTWFQQKYPTPPLTCVAYFCMEFMLSEALPIYSGGLGNVAGDQLKAASDLGVPVVGVGLLYQHGYFRQVIDRTGNQEALYPTNNPDQLPVTPVRASNGELLRIAVDLPGGPLSLRAWLVQVGRRVLYLLDSNDVGNTPTQRGITGELYGGNAELRLQQEIILGIGGWRLLEALGVNPEVCHLNEGHAAFAILERARSFMHTTGLAFNAALAATRCGNLFTTHTAVAAGFDLFPPELIEQYLGRYAQNLGLSLPGLLALGRRDARDPGEPFNMAYLAFRGCGAVNAVSELHGRVSRRIFSPLFPRWPESSVPVGHVTNGVHMPTWDSAASDALWTEACGKARWLGMTATLEADIRKVPDEKLWALRTASRKRVVEYSLERLTHDLTAAGVEASRIEKVRSRLRPDVLTLGFARRFAAYKRPNLLLHDPARLTRILTNPKCPAQLILAGKAHPADKEGQRLIHDWIHFIRDSASNPPVVFLPDYDMLLAEHLVQGVDVWINTPRRPWEACGTSGMKVLVNGGLNLSELDGWWSEAYVPQVGWALGDGEEHGNDKAWDAAEAEALYERLEQEVIPEFYARNDKGIPIGWVARIRESMARLTPRFAANRAVCEYTERHYLPSAGAFAQRSADKGASGQRLAGFESELLRNWPSLHFGASTVETDGAHRVIKVDAFLGDFAPGAVRVELYANGEDGGEPVRQEMTQLGRAGGGSNGFVYSATVTSARPASDFTPRMIPAFEGLAVPLEVQEILWQR